MLKKIVRDTEWEDYFLEKLRYIKIFKIFKPNRK